MQIVFTLPMRNSHPSKKQRGKALESKYRFLRVASSLASRKDERIGPLTNGQVAPRLPLPHSRGG
jgi:hypothetical protein